MALGTTVALVAALLNPVPGVEPPPPPPPPATDLAAAATLVQCQAALFVPVKRGYGIPMPSVLGKNSTYCNLMYGDDPHRGSARRGDPALAIQVLQRNLNYCYGYRLSIDGVYGSNTRAVVRAVQRRHGLRVDGVYGPKTRSAMNWRHYHQPTNTWGRGCSSPL